MSRHRDSDSKIYIGDLGANTTKQDLEESFRQFGPLKNVWVARHPPGFAFIEFEDPRDADDAVRGMDGRTVCGRRVRVEPSNAGGRRRSGGGRGPPPRRGGRPYHPDDKCYQCGDRGHYARDCTRYDRRGRSLRSSSRSRSRSRDRRSRSRGGKHGRSRSASRSHSRSRGGKKSRSRERKRSSSRSRSASHSKRGKPNGKDD